jgi:hypothetical protein
MSTWSDEEIKKAIEGVATKAAEDADFHAKAISNPSAAIEEVAGKAVPAGFKVRFLAQEGYDLTLTLPDPIAADGELSDEDLESVAGGRCSGISSVSSVIACR